MTQPDPASQSETPQARPRTFLGIELTWRLSVDVHADLPKAARRYINKAARAGWLDGDAVSELSDHFRAALLAGRSLDQITAGLGPAAALGAHLGRVRSPARWFMARTFAWSRRAFVACVVAYIALWACLRWAEPSPSVDYYALLNAPTLNSPPDTHAWPYYSKALQDPRMHAQVMYHVFAQPDRVDDATPAEYMIRPGDPGWPRIVAYLHEIQPHLDLIRQGSDKPNLGCLFMRTYNQTDEDRRALAQDPQMPLDPPPLPADHPASRLAAGHVNEFDMPQFSSIQTLTAPITADMLYAADQGDRARVLQNFQTLLKVSRQLRQVPVFTARAYAVGIVNRAVQRMSIIALSYPDLFTVAELADIRRASSNEINQFTTLTPILDVQYLDRVQRAYTQDGGNGRITLNGAIFLFASLGGQDVRTITQAPSLQSRFLAECYLPFLYLTLPREKALTQKRAQILAGALLSDVTTLALSEPWLSVTRPPSYFEHDTLPHPWPTEMLFFGSPADFSTFGGLKTAALWQAQTQAQIDDSLLAVAQYRAQTGGYPDDFAQIIPQFLPKIPAALEEGQWLILKSTPQGPIIYSMGYNKVDDGGLHIPGNDKDTAPQGDHLYFPEYNRRLLPPMTALKAAPLPEPAR